VGLVLDTQEVEEEAGATGVFGGREALPRVGDVACRHFVAVVVRRTFFEVEDERRAVVLGGVVCGQLRLRVGVTVRVVGQAVEDVLDPLTGRGVGRRDGVHRGGRTDHDAADALGRVEVVCLLGGVVATFVGGLVTTGSVGGLCGSFRVVTVTAGTAREGGSGCGSSRSFQEAPTGKVVSVCHPSSGYESMVINLPLLRG
jgi:hypothetical protein